MKYEFTNRKFSKLLVLRPAKYRGKPGRFRWLCLCDCGGFCYATSNSLIEGQKKSCGCGSHKYKKLGLSSSNSYKSWKAMMVRCFNPSHEFYGKYGGLGISVCPDWKSFDNFYRDMGERQTQQTLERLDNSLGYSKENCVWGSRTQQARNRGKFSNNSTGRTGVYFYNGKFRATITYNKKTIHIGLYNTFEEASAARGLKEIELFGFTKE